MKKKNKNKRTKSFKSCSSEGIPALSKKDAEERLKKLNGWHLSEYGIMKIEKTYVLEDFPGSIEFVNKVAEIAERENHHPDIHIFYRKVKIELWTHTVNGLSENDFILAEIIDSIK